MTDHSDEEEDPHHGDDSGGFQTGAELQRCQRFCGLGRERKAVSRSGGNSEKQLIPGDPPNYSNNKDNRATENPSGPDSMILAEPCLLLRRRRSYALKSSQAARRTPGRAAKSKEWSPFCGAVSGVWNAPPRCAAQFCCYVFRGQSQYIPKTSRTPD